MIKKAIIPAAGFGTRNLPISKTVPKEMFPVGLKPAIEYVIEEAVDAGIEQILIVVSRSKQLIIDYFDPSFELENHLKKKNKLELLDKITVPKVEILYTRQAYANGLGDAIRLGKNFVGEDPFAVLLPDDIILKKGRGIKELIATYESTNSSVIGLKEIATEHLKKYGVIKGAKVPEIAEKVYKITDIVEKPQHNPPSNLAVIGRYVFTPTIMKFLDILTPGAGGEIQLTDGIKDLLDKENCYGRIISGDRYDIGIESDYIKLINKVYELNNESV
ncbi:UTP--glucose-1-phosphate uridylyltransferase [Bacillus sp. 31A1R]|uniref:UTP--glucose-1-phosphate uridylyltransferase n=1 Tax=Robertmurraya mangrovi TaxID=3098077 RepID=A0ABU5J2Q6_9BACI|nr:UTP--glucose-1-phosphate uridylyltransferase [Bacillus sp. 31A1R]MDZ5473693.1 UTP--glucose-1-phosphate uridylyltransferase [Bacillus sp. 31A1R]